MDTQKEALGMQETFSRKVKPTTFILLGIVVILLLVATFMKPSPNPIARTWENPQSQVTWHFMDNYQGQKFVFQEHTNKKTGQWSLNNTALTLTFDADSTQNNAIITQAYTVQQNGKKLNLVGANNSYQLQDSSSMIGDFFDNGLLRGFIGIFSLLFIAFLLSQNRRMIDWNLVVMGVSLQILFGLGVLKVPLVKNIFEFVSSFFVKVLDFTNAGAGFLFGNLMTASEGWGYIFAFQVLPTVIFFSALSAMLYYLGILQIIVYGFAWVMSKTMRLSGAESLAAAANIFIGQTEAPLVVKPYLNNMTKSEIMCLMTGGMATIAGGVFAAYVGFLGGTDPVQQLMFAKHLLSASIMSAPAAIVAAKMLFPESNMEKVNRQVEIPKHKIGSNLLEAIANGTTDGLKLAVNVGAMLIAFIALIAMFNSIFSDLIGHYSGLNDVIVDWSDGRYKGLTLELIFGLLFSPIAWLIGVPSVDMISVGQLLGTKTIVNEFVAYASMGTMKDAGLLLEQKSLIIATYALCGFSNLSSIGIQIGGISALAPNQRTTLASLGILSLVGGTIACFMTGVIAGMLVA